MTKMMCAALAAATLLLAHCATTGTAPVATPQGDDRYLIDPRIGFTTAPDPTTDNRIGSAWRAFLARDFVKARRQLAELRKTAPNHPPAALLEALIALREGNISTAQSTVDRLLQERVDYTAAVVAAAEIAIARNDTRRALELYRSLLGRSGSPATVSERITTLERRLFEELVATAQTAADTEAIRLLAEALTMNPGAADARMMLVGRLLSIRQYDEARRYIEPLLAAGADRPDVQEALAEIDAGRGRYQEAIVRYERLQRRTPDPRYQRRLEEIKESWSLANMPPQFQAALESPDVTRGDFAVLLYWRVSSVRFAQNLGSPPIAIDIDVPGREEIIRAIAVGLYEVDPVTRRVSPQRPITTASLARLAARLLSLRGAACAKGMPLDRVLESCGISDPLSNGDPEAPVTGREALRVLDQIERTLSKT